jgi:hypothetical protein
MAIYSDLMGFYSDSMGCYWDLPSGKHTKNIQIGSNRGNTLW